MADSTLQNIKDRLNIADVIGSYITIKKSGTNFKAVCPFHHEKSGSLMVSPQKQIWHCFGCGEGGDVFGFVMRYENIEFKEALKILAQKAGIKLPEYKPTNKLVTDQNERLVRINNFASRFYHEILLRDKRAESARKYLKERGLSLETLAQWQIGFAPDEFHSLEQALGKKKVSVQDLVAAGVSAKNERGHYYDRFRNRITFPIFNYMGDVAGFTARVLPTVDPALVRATAKYINSPETPIYNKSKILFGLNFAKQEIRKKDEVIIVEGQMDCITAAQAGFKNIVASSGTALTKEQLTLLSRLTKNFKFCFDTDAAGLKATRRAVESYLGQDVTIKIISLKDAKDPDELIRKSPADFRAAVADAALFLDFYIDQSFVGYNSKSVEQKKAVAKEILPLLRYLSDPLEQDHYVQLLAQKFGTSAMVLLDSLKKTSIGKAVEIQKKPPSRLKEQAPIKPNALEKQVLGGMLTNGDFLKHVLKNGERQDFNDPQIKELTELLFNGTPQIAQQIVNSPLAKEATFMVELQLEDLGGSPEILNKELGKAFNLLRLTSIKDRQKKINIQIKGAELAKKTAELKTLNQEFAKLTLLRMSFEKLV